MMLNATRKRSLEWKYMLRTCAMIAHGAMLMLFLAGCPHRDANDKPIPITGRQPDMAAAEKDAGAKQAPGDYFPLWIPASWTYNVRECYKRIIKEEHPAAEQVPDDVCTRYEIRTKLDRKIVIDGRDVFLLLEGKENKLKEAPSGDNDKKPQNQPNEKSPAGKPSDGKGTVSGKGYMSDGDWVYLVFVEDGKIVEKSIAGKHNLKPGDSWDKKFLGGYDTTERIVCGEPGYLHLPDDDPTPALYKTICCTNKNNPGFKPGDYYAVCYSPEIGRVAEYASNVISEVISYSVRKDGQERELPPAKPR